MEFYWNVIADFKILFSRISVYWNVVEILLQYSVFPWWKGNIVEQHYKSNFLDKFYCQLERGWKSTRSHYHQSWILLTGGQILKIFFCVRYVDDICFSVPSESLFKCPITVRPCLDDSNQEREWLFPVMRCWSFIY